MPAPKRTHPVQTSSPPPLLQPPPLPPPAPSPSPSPSPSRPTLQAPQPDIHVLIARSSIGAALDDVKKRGIEAHLVDLEREMHPRRGKKSSAKKLSDEDRAFMRGFGVALASIWRCHHDGQMVKHLIKENNFKLSSFRGIALLEADYVAIRQAVEQ